VGDKGGTKNSIDPFLYVPCAPTRTVGDDGGMKKLLGASGVFLTGPGEGGGIKNIPVVFSPSGDGCGGIQNAVSVGNPGVEGVVSVTRCLFNAGLRSMIFEGIQYRKKKLENLLHTYRWTL
jgi:hypothetical protein